MDSQNGEFEAQLVGDVFRRAGVAVAGYDDGLVVHWRDGFWVATNFTERRQTAPAPPEVKLIVGQRDPPPAGVAVWQE